MRLIKWFVIGIVALAIIGAVIPDSDAPLSEPTLSASSTPSATAIPVIPPTSQTSGCNVITSQIYDVASKLAGLNSTYTVEDVLEPLKTAGDKWGSWSTINTQDGNPEAGAWLAQMSESALKLRVSLINLDAEGVASNATSLYESMGKSSNFCG